MSWSEFTKSAYRWERAEARFRELAAKEALGTITPEECLKLDRYTALRRSRIPPEPREARVAAYRDKLYHKYLTAFTMGRGGLVAWVNYNRLLSGGWPAR